MKLLDQVSADARHALRNFARAPLFTLSTIVILALAVGANAAVFAFIDASLLRPLPGITEPEGLVAIATDRDRGSVGYRSYEALHGRQTVFDGIAAASLDRALLDSGDGSDIASVWFVGGDFFRTLRLRMALGAPLPATSERDGTPEPLAVIGYDYWKKNFGGEASVVGRSIRVNGTPLTVVCVAPAGLWLHGDVYTSLANRLHVRAMGGRQAHAIPLYFFGARLRPGATIEQARDQVKAIALAMPTARYTGRDMADVQPLRLGTPAEIIRSAGFVGNATVFILLIACASRPCP